MKNTLVNSAIRISFLLGALILGSTACQADIVMSLTKLTGDTSEAVEAQLTNVANYSSVKYAINYGNQQVTNPIGGVTFVNRGGTNYYTAYTYKDENENDVRYGYNTPQQSFTSRGTQGTTSHAGNTYGGTQSTELNKLLGSMMYVTGGQYANTYATLTFGNLDEGKTYTARILARSWGTNNPNRQHTFSIDLNADGIGDTFTYGGNQVTSQLVSEDQPFSGETYAGAYAVDFTFTAQSNTATINLLSGATSNQPWHNYGVMLIESSAERQAVTPTIYNGSFEADKWTLQGNTDNGHAYLDGSNTGVISGWQFTNMTDTSMRAGLAWENGPCQHFLGNQTIPDGNQLAWLQSHNTDSRLYQNVYGFNPEDKDTVYRVSMELGTRGTNKPSFSLYIGEDQATEKAYISSKEVPSGKFTTYGAVFAPNADTQAIAIGNYTSGDNTLLIDNVQLKAYELTTFFSDNYHVAGNRKGPNIGQNANDPDDRFAGGLLGGLAYKVKVKSNDQIQVGNGANKEALFFAVHNNGYEFSHASPDYNFANVGAMSAAEEGGRMYDISFRVAPQYEEAVTSGNWAAVIFGLSEDKQTEASVNSGDGVGILFRRNGGIQVFDRNSKIVDLAAGTFALTNNWADVRVVYYVPAFDGTSQVEGSLYVNDQFVTSFLTSQGFTDNYIQLEAYTADTSGSYKRTLMDDFVVKSSAELQYDVSRIQNLSRDWSPNGKDKMSEIVFNAENVTEGSDINHTGALDMEVDTTLDVGEGLTLTQSGNVTGNKNLTKTGEGTLILDAPATAANVIVSKGELDLNGTVTGNVDVKSGTTFSPGNDVGAATVDGTFTAEAGSTLRFERNANGQVDSLTALEFNIDDATRIELALGTFGAAAEIDLITNSSETGFTPEQSTPDFWMRKLVEALPHYMELSVFNNSIVRLTVDGNAIPEPSAWVLLLLGAFGLLYWRKRK